MKAYLSFGAGVNSTALMVLLRDRGIEFEAIFADTGCEWPETYAHILWLEEHGWPITVVRGDDPRRGSDLAKYCQRYAIMPSRWLRWCTQQYKVEPLHKHVERPALMYLGIDAGEVSRAKPAREDWLTHEFPLVDEGINRGGCMKIIRKAGIPMPRKSGCFICPFQRVGQWRELRDRHPDLYAVALSIEIGCNARLEQAGKARAYLSSAAKPLASVVQEGQQDIFGWREPCAICEVMA